MVLIEIFHKATSAENAEGKNGDQINEGSRTVESQI